MTVARQSALDPIEQGGGDGGDADGGEGAWARLKQLCLAIEAAIGRLELAPNQVEEGGQLAVFR